MLKTTAKKTRKPKTVKCSNGRLRINSKLESRVNGVIFEVNIKSMRNNFTSKAKKPVSSLAFSSKILTRMNQVGDRALIKSPCNSLYLFHIAQNRYTCLLSASEEVDYFDFLDKADSSILVVFRNKQIQVLTQSGSVLQKITNEKKRIKHVEVQSSQAVFMICYERHLEFYNMDASNNKRWNLWKKMFAVSKETIKTAKLSGEARRLTGSQVIILFSTLELSVYSIKDRNKLYSLKLGLASSHSTSLFPLPCSKAMLLGTSKVNLLFLDLEFPCLTDFAVPFTDSKLHKTQQILTKDNNFVFLNDYNQIIFCKFIAEKSDISPGSSSKNMVIANFSFESRKVRKMVVDLVLKFDDEKERVLDFTINSLGNIILILFASGKTRFMDVDILKKNYDSQMPEYLVEGESSEVAKLPCDDLARTTGIVQGNTFKKVSKFKTDYFHKARETLKKSSLTVDDANRENRSPNLKESLGNPKSKLSTGSHRLKDLLATEGSLFSWKPVSKMNGLASSLCDEDKHPKFGLLKLKNFLKKYGAFPDDMRLAIWGYLLNIPLKKGAYDQLKFLGQYKPGELGSSNSNILLNTDSLKSEILKWKSKWNLKTGQPTTLSGKTLPIKDSQLSRQFHSIRNCLSQHSSFFFNNPVSDRLLFPFVKLFPKQGLRTFEIYLTFCSHWLQPLYSCFPSLSPEVQTFIESVLRVENPELLGVVRQTSLISTLFDSLLAQFTDVLSKDCWLQVFDFLFCFSEYPELFLLVLPSLLIILQQDLMDFASKESLPISTPSDRPDILENIRESEDLLQDDRLKSLTTQINFTTQVNSHQLDSNFSLSLSRFTDCFLAKLRLIPGSKVVKQLHLLLRRCYSNSLFPFQYSPSCARPSTELHYPLFNFTTRLII